MESPPNDIELILKRMTIQDISKNLGIIFWYLKKDNLYKDIDIAAGDLPFDEYSKLIKLSPGFMYYFGVWNWDEPMGIIICTVFGPNVLTFHGGVFEKYRHLDTPLIVSLVLQKVRKYFNRPTLQLITSVPVTKPHVGKLLTKMGYEKVLLIEKGYGNIDMEVWK